LIGALVYLLWSLTRETAFVTLGLLGVTLLPIFVTGGVHLDGFCDTADALASHAEPARKREILKDPHTGAFAVIGAAMYLLAYFVLVFELPPERRAVLVFAVGFVLTRALSGLCVLVLPSSSEEGLTRTFKVSADKKNAVIALAAELILCCGAMLLTDAYYGGAAILASALCAARLVFMAKKHFGGMSGDLAGYFLQLCELSQLFAIVLVWHIGVM
ncbi:MAG: adenosylcobinamide-GDP ribazoletransferase, partial [Oscillospiraceae bacterium]|nr:adenosylcobinamide-GDP ribazoletransferase [Oscillospiraceae bacterium]